MQWKWTADTFFANITDGAECGACVSGGPAITILATLLSVFFLLCYFPLNFDGRALLFSGSGRAPLSSTLSSLKTNTRPLRTDITVVARRGMAWFGSRMKARCQRCACPAPSSSLPCAQSHLIALAVCAVCCCCCCCCRLLCFGWSPRCTQLVGISRRLPLILFGGNASHTNHFISSISLSLYMQYKE